MAGNGWASRALARLEEATGLTVERTDRLTYLEEAETDRRTMERELQLLAYSTLDYFSGRPQELKAEERRKLAQKSRVVWMKDPQAGAAIDLKNDFVFGRGVPKPKAKDKAVQEVIDRAWDAPSNRRILTSHEAQLALGTDMELQSNLFFLLFDDGDDGEVRVSLLDHDTVENVVEHPDDRFRVLYFLARARRQEWDFDKDSYKQFTGAERDREGKPKVLYYEHWRNVEESKEDGDFPDGYDVPAAKRGEGRVFHVADNRTTEMHFGHPRFDRLLRWFNAYNRFMEARVDMTAAAAAFVMKRKVKGTPSQVQKMATQALSRRGELGQASLGLGPGPSGYDPTATGPVAGVITENENVTHEDFKVSSGAGDASQDARMLGAQISAATRFPRIYFGDADAGGSLATATSLELPILKAVETRQEMFEAVFRWFTDRAIERAVDKGLLDKRLSPDELEEAREAALLRRIVAAGGGRARDGEAPEAYVGRVLELIEAHEDKADDEVATERDLSYEFSMPNPLRRAMNDLLGGIQTIAQTFDPNNTNVELSRILLNVALGDALELQDAGDLVQRIYPEGYVDPAVAAAQGAAGGEGGDPNDFGPFGPGADGGGAPAASGAPPSGSVGADGRRHQEGNAYGAPQRARAPEEVAEAAFPDLPSAAQDAAGARLATFADDLATEVAPEIDAALRELGVGA